MQTIAGVLKLGSWQVVLQCAGRAEPAKREASKEEVMSDDKSSLPLGATMSSAGYGTIGSSTCWRVGLLGAIQTALSVEPISGAFCGWQRLQYFLQPHNWPKCPKSLSLK